MRKLLSDIVYLHLPIKKVSLIKQKIRFSFVPHSLSKQPVCNSKALQHTVSWVYLVHFIIRRKNTISEGDKFCNIEDYV